MLDIIEKAIEKCVEEKLSKLLNEDLKLSDPNFKNKMEGLIEERVRADATSSWNHAVESSVTKYLETFDLGSRVVKVITEKLNKYEKADKLILRIERY